MRVCPKCRTFFDDELLKFCLNDGLPLAEINQSNQLWEDGINFVRESNQKILLQTRKEKLKKILKMFLTMILIIMVISVITLWSWIYLDSPKDEAVQKPSPSPTVEASPTETPKVILVGLITPTPTPKPTPTLSASPTLSPTVQISPTITATPFICNEKEKENAKTDLLTSNQGYITNSIANLEKDLAIKYYQERHPAGVSPTLFNKGEMIVEMTNCLSAKVTFKSEWIPTTENYMRGVPPFKGTKVFNCNKKGKKWNCIYIG